MFCCFVYYECKADEALTFSTLSQKEVLFFKIPVSGQKSMLVVLKKAGFVGSCRRDGAAKTVGHWDT